MTTNTLNNSLSKLFHDLYSAFKKMDKKSLRILLAAILFGFVTVIMIFLTIDNRSSYSNSMGSIMPTKNIEDRSIRFFNH